MYVAEIKSQNIFPQAIKMMNEDKWSVSDMREKEATYFLQHPYFSKIPSSFFGIANLSKKLTTLLVSHSFSKNLYSVCQYSCKMFHLNVLNACM